MHVTLEKAASLLNSGHVVAIPTETVYGMAASLHFPKAIADIFHLKGRPSNNPLIVHLASIEEISFYTEKLPPQFTNLASTFWPGPLTLVIPIKQDKIPTIARAELPTAAFRIPQHPLTQELLKKTGPLVMPSANLSGKPSATSAEHVLSDFGKNFPVLDGGECAKGVESTILCWNQTEWTIIRLGALIPEVFFQVLGYTPEISKTTKEHQIQPLCPGQLYRHYSPNAKLILLDKIPEESEGIIIGFNDRIYPKKCSLFSLGSSSDPESAAHHLYSTLRLLDIQGILTAYVDMDFPNVGLWQTLRERLQKAAHS